MTYPTHRSPPVRLWLALALLTGVQLAQPLPAGANPCDAAALRAAQDSTVPLAVLRALSRTESGRNRNGRLEPWPWTVNMDGAGHWFDSRTAALAYVRMHHAGGVRNFDVGCFQINHRWHGSAFRSLEQMFDPLENARYAAAFLTRLYAETSSWARAVGAYHSRTPQLARRYRARFDRIHKAMLTQSPRGSPGLPHKAGQATAANGFSLLRSAGASPVRGSLVPLPEARGPALIQLGTREQGS